MFSFDEMNFGYSKEGLVGRIELLKEFVDVEFYFEDENNEQFYEVLLNKLFPDLITDYVFCLGGKDPIIAESNRESKSGNPRIFLIDKDFDDLLTKNKNKEGVIRLNAYSIENYFIDHIALSKVAVSKFSGMRLSTLNKKNIEVEKEFSRILLKYSKLAKLFYAVQKFGIKNIQTSKKRISDLVINKTIQGILPEEVIEKYIEKIIYESNKQNKRLQDIKAIEDEIALDFLPKNGCNPIGEINLRPNLPGKHLLKMLCILYDRICDTKFESLPSQLILISLTQNILDFSNLFHTVKNEITSSLERQAQKN